MKNKFYLLTVPWLLSACMKTPSNKIEYGLEVDRDLVIRSLATAVGPTDSPSQILKEEVVQIASTQEIRGRPVLDIFSVTNITAVELKETTNQWQVNVIKQYQKFDPFKKETTYPVIISEDPRCWDKVDSERKACEIEVISLSQQKTPRQSNFEERILLFNPAELIQPFEDFGLPEEDRSQFTYHKLEVKRGQIPPPDAVKNSPNCRNIPNCLINASLVEFDLVDWTRSKEGVKIHHKLLISPDVPKMARILNNCQQGSVPVPQLGSDPLNPPRVLVTICNIVTDFIPGKL